MDPGYLVSSRFKSTLLWAQTWEFGITTQRFFSVHAHGLMSHGPAVMQSCSFRGFSSRFSRRRLFHYYFLHQTFTVYFFLLRGSLVF